MMIFCPGIQLYRLKPLRSLGVHGFNVQWGAWIFIQLYPIVYVHGPVRALWPHLFFAEYTLFTLQPTWMYPPPNGKNDNLCQCSTVGYSLFSACAGCQEQGWVRYGHIDFFNLY